MNTEVEQLIRQATSQLRLRDIILFESHLIRGEMPPPMESVDAFQQHKRGVKFTRVAKKEDSGVGVEIHILVTLGERVVDDPDAVEPNDYFRVEADYLVIYRMTEDVSDSALKAFADYNAVHNVWPFWRQHVFDLVAQARLPQLQVPLFSGNGP